MKLLRKESGVWNGSQSIHLLFCKIGMLHIACITEAQTSFTKHFGTFPLTQLQATHEPLSSSPLSVGIPQIILPSSHNTFDFANRAEWLGIGLYGSRSFAPSASAVEF